MTSVSSTRRGHAWDDRALPSGVGVAAAGEVEDSVDIAEYQVAHKRQFIRVIRTAPGRLATSDGVAWRSR